MKLCKPCENRETKKGYSLGGHVICAECQRVNNVHEKRLLITHRDLQVHIHSIGLKAFLDQLKDVFHLCAEDTLDLEFGAELAAQYENAEAQTDILKETIFGKGE